MTLKKQIQFQFKVNIGIVSLSKLIVPYLRVLNKHDLSEHA